MKKYISITLLFLSAYMTNNAAASTSSCTEYYVGTAPYMAHSSTYSASEAALDIVFGMTSSQASPFVSEYKSYYTPNGSGGSETVAGPVTYAGVWTIGGVSAIGHHESPYFVYVPSTYSNVCTKSKTYNKPSSAYMDINPSTAVAGDSVNFQWGASYDPDYCTLTQTATTLGASGNANVTVALSDAGIYTITCTNVFGTSSPASDTLTVLECDENETSYSIPANAPNPPTNSPTYINGGSSWGRTTIGANYNALQCPQRCVNNQLKYRLEGRVERTSTSKMEVSQGITAWTEGANSCVASSRTSGNKTRTTTHEIHHRDEIMSVIHNSKILGVGNVFDTYAACDAQLAYLTITTSGVFAAEVNQQQAHSDGYYSGQSHYARSCSVNNDPTLERECGVGGWNCSPSNTY